MGARIVPEGKEYWTRFVGPNEAKLHSPPPQPRPARRRDRAATQAHLVAAVGSLLDREGFAALGVNAIAREAHVDKVLIYRYFDGLDGLLCAYAREEERWPSVDEVVGEDAAALAALPRAERLGETFVRLVRVLRERPGTVELLAWEAVERGPVVVAFEEVRERRVAELIGAVQGGDDIHRGLIAALLASASYLLVRSRRSDQYAGLDLDSDEGWREIETSLRAFAQAACAGTD